MKVPLECRRKPCVHARKCWKILFPACRKSWKLLKARGKVKRIHDLQEQLINTHHLIGDDLDFSELCTLHLLQSDPKFNSMARNNNLIGTIVNTWQDEGTKTFMEYLAMHDDECLLLKDQMMISYEKWDHMRKVMHRGDLTGATPMKKLAKFYNELIKDELGLKKIEGVNGYMVNMEKIIPWMVDIALANGQITESEVPEVIKIKISLDGSNMGSREAELVGVTPMNLGFNPQSYNSIFPIMLYEGKETREDLKKMLKPINNGIKQLKKPFTLPKCHAMRAHTCHFTLCADYFALLKIMVPKKGEILEDGETAEGCTCGFCGEQRKQSIGWTSNLHVGVWETIPALADHFESCLLDVPLSRITFCLLHAKVRIIGSMLKHMLRECEVKSESDVITMQDNMRKIIPTFKITLKGEKTTKGTVAKGAKVSALQGEQCDKIMLCVRAHYFGPFGGRDELEAEAAKHWSELMGQIPWNLKRHSNLVGSRQFNRLWELLIKWYDIGNNHDKATAAQMDAYRQHVREFGQIWVDQFTLAGVTPYVHIICKHSGAYLQQLGSFRPWSQESFEAAHKRNKRYYMKTNFGGGKNGDASSAYLQVLQKLFRIQKLEVQVATQEVDKARQKAKHLVWSYHYRTALRRRNVKQAQRRKHVRESIADVLSLSQQQ